MLTVLVAGGAVNVEAPDNVHGPVKVATSQLGDCQLCGTEPVYVAAYCMCKTNTSPGDAAHT